MKYTEKRRNGWYAVLTVPSEVRSVIGKRRFVESLKTSDEKKANLLAGTYVLEWKQLIEAARLQLARGEVPKPAPVVPKEVPVVSRVEPSEPLVELLDKFLKTLEVNELTAHRYRSKILMLMGDATSFYGITSRTIKAAVQRNKWSKNTAKRIVSIAARWFDYLEHENHVLGVANPFKLSRYDVLDLPQRTSGPKGYIPWEDHELGVLWKASHTFGTREEKILPDIIAIAAHSGMRADEICSMRLVDIHNDAFHVYEAKTAAGDRVVPIHPIIRPLVERLKAASTDEYLFPGLSVDKAHGRASIPCQSFMRLRRHCGFHGYKQKVFHSIRKTFVTQLERAGVPENLAADIVGHEKPRITYGLYSGGASMELKREAVGLVRYDWYPGE